jgi:large subunit ribosomal protein L31
MKPGLHPEYIATKVTCNGCKTVFDSRSTVSEITVEICSNCHPFYTGKQKLIDTAGRVDRFNARRTAASKIKQAQASKTTHKAAQADVTAEIEQELEAKTVDLPAPKNQAKPKSDS